MRRIAVLALTAAAVLLPASPASAATPLPSDGYVGVDGHGYGHGKGLGQWGAKGLADQGKTWGEILAHYYPSTTTASRAAEAIRVLVEDSADALAYSKSAFSVWWKGGSKIADATAAEPFLRAVVSGSQIAVQRGPGAGGPWTTLATGTGPAEFHPGSDTIGLVSATGSIRYYRGRIEAKLPSGAATLLAINELGMEPYLYGVVPREMPASWDGDALRAQTVAARTYAARAKDAARAAGKLYDICATTSCQVYGGYASASSPSATPTVIEHANTNAAVEATAGTVLHYGGKPILAQYSSSTGGYTAAGSEPYQQAKPDPADAISPHHSWTTRVSVATIQSVWSQIGSLTGIRITKRNGYGDWGGRVTEMVIEGTAGTATVSGGTFRSKTGLKSDWFKVRTYRGELAGSSAEVSGPSGGTIPVSVSLRNTGTAEWKVGGAEMLATWNPSGRASVFVGPGWVSASKPARITKNLSRPSATTVGVGETAEFRFTLYATDVAPGLYVEAFRPLEDGLTWMPDVGITISVRVLASWVEEAGNLATNGSFEAGWSEWRGSGVKPGDGPAVGTVRAGSRSMHLAAGGRKVVVQSLSVAGGAGRRFVVSGWARTSATSAGGGPVGVNLALHNADGTISWNLVEFARGPHDWAYAERVVTAPKQFVRAELYALFYDQTGHVYFDALRMLDTWVANPSFDAGLSSWTPSGLGAGDGPSGNVFRDGFRSMHFAGGTKSVTQRVPVRGPAGRMYAAGGWTKADRANAAGTTSIWIAFNNLDGTRSTVGIPATAGDHDWEFAETHAAAPKPFGSIDVVLSVAGQSGSIFFDGIRLRENRLPNASFEAGLAPWEEIGSPAGAVVDTVARDAARSLSIAAGTGRRGVKASIASSGPAGAAILVGGWNRTTASASSPAGVWLAIGFRNTDGTATWRNLYFPAAAHDWVHREMLARSDKPYTSIDVYALADDPAGDVAFDGLALWALA